MRRSGYKMNVLHINSNYLTSKLHENLLDKIESEDLHNTVFMPIKFETQDDFLYESKHEVHSPVTFNNRDKYFFTYKQNKIYKKLLETLEVNDFDVVHAHTLFTDGNNALRLYKEYGIPYVVTVRGFTDIESFFKIRINLRKKGREILQEASKVIFLSALNREQLLNQYIPSEALKNEIMNKSIILPNGIDDFWFENEGPVKTLKPKQELSFIQVGKIYKRKNILGSIAGIKIYDEENNKNSQLTVVGGVEDEDYAKSVQSETELTVNMVSQTDREELIQIYRENDIFIMPSFQETFGLVYPEAMSQGLPVIYSKGQGFDNQFPDGEVGYAVEADNPQDIAQKIELILNDYENISKRALEKYKKFNWDILSKHYVDIYKNLLK